MTTKLDIGKEARELDGKSLSERLKVEKRSKVKISIAIICYSLIMTLLYFLL